jgi:hypothetical protein
MTVAASVPQAASPAFAPMSAGRLFVFGGIALIAFGMIFGDIFAIFILHQNAGKQGAALQAAAEAVARKDSQAANAGFQRLGGLLEDRGTKVDAHAHMIGAGYLALLLALVQPYVALGASRKRFLAKLFMTGAALLPLGIFLIRYVGLAYSPSRVIGWASILADAAGLLLIIALLGEGWGIWSYLRQHSRSADSTLMPDGTWTQRILLSGGTFLVLLGFLHGAYYAAFDLYRHEAMETSILNNLLTAAVGNDSAGITQQVNNFGMLAGERAVNIAAHSHVIEFGLLAILLSFVQPYIFLSEVWRRRWASLLLAGSLTLPMFVLLELKLGLLAGGIADAGGLMVVVALFGMLVGVLRYTGSLDAAEAGR